MWKDTYEALSTITEKLSDLNQELLRSPAAAELRKAITALGDEYPVLRPQIELEFSFAGDDSSGATFRHSFGLEYSAGNGVVPFERGLQYGRFHAADFALLTALDRLSLAHQIRYNAAQDAASEMDELRRAGQAPTDPDEQDALQTHIAEERRREAWENWDSWRASVGERMTSR
jgi:hypothetical protein